MVKSSKNILVDIDDCVLQWRKKFFSYTEDRGFPANVTKFNCWRLEDVLEVSKEIADGIVTEFNSGHWQFGTLDPFIDAYHGLRDLNCEGYRFIAISSCGDGETTLALRRANLYQHFGDIFDDVHCLEVFSDKFDVLSKYEPSVFIDDSVGQVNSAVKAGHTAILIKRPWNENLETHEDVLRLDDWEAIRNHITKEL